MLDYGVKLAGALESSHREGVLHRDVKPENVMLSAWGEPHLGDFGIARVKGAYETAAGKVTATLVHAAPELLGGQSPGPSSDLYALASTLYELLAGVPAFWVGEEDTIAPLLKRIALDPPPDLRPQGVPAAVADVARARIAEGADRSTRLGRRVRPPVAGDAAGMRSSDHQDVGDARRRAGRAPGRSGRVRSAFAPRRPSSTAHGCERRGRVGRPCRRACSTR